MSTRPDMRTKKGAEFEILAYLHKSKGLVTDWWATAIPRRAAAWERLRRRKVIVPADRQPEYPHNRFLIQPHQ